MKLNLTLVCLLLIGFGCSSPITNSENESLVTADGTEIEGNETGEIFAKGQELLRQLEGDYFELYEEGAHRYYPEPCGYASWDVQIREIYEETGYWEISWAGESYDIVLAEKEESGNIVIETSSEVEERFTFMANPDPKVWNFDSGRRQTPDIVRVEDIENFDMRPCTNAVEIMQHLATTWYELEEVDDQEVIIEPCESAPAGFDIAEDGSTIDFRSGSDPDEIVSMTKLNSRITIVYRPIYGGEERTLVIHNKYGGVAQVGVGTEDDPRYVTEASSDTYEKVEEDC